ncbi:hypothetical protein CLOM_g20367 [Closterium sp. NIES-68]|nr:hypothetical protein CLOM_g20367 [Closterium sp. NIES-68]GJP65433.1 hypothetical protein CLOP_g22311 [Closterium sp. NIES-67]
MPPLSSHQRPWLLLWCIVLLVCWQPPSMNLPPSNHLQLPLYQHQLRNYEGTGVKRGERSWGGGGAARPIILTAHAAPIAATDNFATPCSEESTTVSGRVQDGPSLPLVQLNASFVLLQGRLAIGAQQQHFSQRAVIALTPNPNARAPLLFSSAAPADERNPRNLGHKALAVIGGQLDLHGMPGGASTPSWCQLARTAPAGTASLLVDADVSAWPVGGLIAVSSTDYNAEQAEELSITAVTTFPNGTSLLTLSRPLSYSHFGDPLGVPDGFGGYINERAEVALLSRTVTITSTPEASPYEKEGGHVSVYFTQRAQVVEGVEFSGLGQEGLEGRFPLHYLFHGKQQEGGGGGEVSVCRKNSFHHTKNRCVVLTATSGMTVDGNVAYDTRGHCFVLSSGSETRNTLCNNLGFLTRRASKDVSGMHDTGNPATFLLTNPDNDFVNNTAAGSQAAGVWYYLRWGVSGLPATIPSLYNLLPFFTPWGTVSGCTFHSNGLWGLQAYPMGAYPRQGAFRNFSSENPFSVQWMKPIERVLFSRLTFYKHQGSATLMDTFDAFTMRDSVFADNQWALYLAETQHAVVDGCRFVGLSNNYGAPQGCTSAQPWDCAPITGCKLPLTSDQLGRSTGGNRFPFPLFGIVYDQRNFTELGDTAALVANTTFFNYDATCRIAAGFALGLSPLYKDYFNAGQAVKNVSFKAANRMWIPGDTFPFLGGSTIATGAASPFLMLHDIDGSLTGTAPGSVKEGGYAIANVSFLLPPAKLKGAPVCSPRPQWNGYACPKACYRSVAISYFEPGFSPINDSPDARKRGTFSYLEIVRVEDKASFFLDGNLNVRYMNVHDTTLRYFYPNLLAGMTYEITIRSPNGSSWTPSYITAAFQDGGSCGQGLTLRVLPLGQGGAGPQRQLLVGKESTSVGAMPIPGNPIPSTKALYSFVCAATAPVPALSLTMGGNFSDIAYLIPVADTAAASSCTSTFMSSQQRSILFAGSDWLYDDSGLDLSPPYPGARGFSSPTPLLAPPVTTVPKKKAPVVLRSIDPPGAWRPGKGPFGWYANWNHPAIATLLSPVSPSRVVYYFRTNFTVTNTKCYSVLRVDLLLSDGAVVYINGVEAIRTNMPAGALTNSTLALSNLEPLTKDPIPYTSFTVPLATTTVGPAAAPAGAVALVEGVNFMAVQVHAFQNYAWEVAFDMRIYAQQPDPKCKGKAARPETCDGLDNDGDGKVDIGPTKKPISVPCSTACGVGTMLCVDGALTPCSARQPAAESCNGLDDDCDGLVDNAVGASPCGEGAACFNGSCRSVVLHVGASVVVKGGEGDWLFADQGTNLGSSYPNWKTNAGLPSGLMKAGKAPFGFNSDSAAAATYAGFTTPLANSAGKYWTMYFVKAFNLSATQAASTYSYDVSVRRDDGAVVYLNGNEMFRTNMPSGTIADGTVASGVTQTDPGNGNNKQSFYTCGESCYGRNMTGWSKPGINWVAAELHQAYLWSSDSAFDLSLSRLGVNDCPASNSSSPSPLASPCIRSTYRALLPEGTVWRINDAAISVPPTGWHLPAFDDSAWPSGPGVVGSGGWWNISKSLTKAASGSARRAYYFRTAFTVPDGPCFFNLTLWLLVNDGAVVYINGAEAVRRNVPKGADSTTPASSWGNWIYNPYNVNGQWLKPAGVPNVVAVEVHLWQPSQDLFFALQMAGQREAVTCKPAP